VKVASTDPSTSGQPGDVLTPNSHEITIQCGSGTIQIVTLQPDGKRAMPVGDFLRGRKLAAGDRFQ
jgi:methionyl-tRNA formyltransferase